VAACIEAKVGSALTVSSDQKQLLAIPPS
jgi:hypothetical protein